jgi:Mn2+/Fe2+ NRAMP family transporter
VRRSDKGLKLRDLNFARIDTAFGAVATQIIMIAIVVTTAATLYVRHISVNDAAHAALALIPLTGRASGIIFGAALIGAAMLGAFVVSLATSWAFGEAFNWPCSLNFRATEAKRFYGLYATIVALAAAIVLVPNLPLVRITLYVEAGNALVLPLVLGFLLVMANDKKILGERRNSLLGNIVAIGISAICICLGFWYAALTFMGQAG